MARYTIKSKGEDIPREYPGVTTITGQIDKSAILMKWAVKMMLKWLHKNWVKYVTEEIKNILKDEKDKSPVWIEFESKDDYFKMLEDGKDHYEEISDDARIVGNCVHDLSHEYIKAEWAERVFLFDYEIKSIAEKNKLPKELIKTVESRFKKVLEWYEKNVVRFLESEQPIFSEDPGYCGTFDQLVELKPCSEKDNMIIGGIYMIDLKSSKGFYDGQREQICAYRRARQKGCQCHMTFKDDNDKENIIIEEHDINLEPIKIDGVGILSTNFKDAGNVQFKDFTPEIRTGDRSFLNLLRFYYDFKNRRLKNNPFTLKGRLDK